MADKTADVERLNIEINFVQKLAIVDAFDDTASPVIKRYIANPSGAEAAALLKSLFNKVAAAFPQQHSVTLRVKGARILG